MLIKLAILEISFVMLDEAWNVTNRRVNALENITFPKSQGILENIACELDQLECEDVTCLKLVYTGDEKMSYTC
eukprot:14731287-Ditylum_brightwellii.AAC.1